MSLLNEALRKNTSKGRPEMPKSFADAKSFNIKNIIIIGVPVIIAVSAMFWAFSSRNTAAPPKPVMAAATPVAVEYKNPPPTAASSQNTDAADVKPQPDNQPAKAADSAVTDTSAKKMTDHSTAEKPVADQTPLTEDNAAKKDTNIKTPASEPDGNAGKPAVKKRQGADIKSGKQDNKDSMETDTAQEDAATSADRFYQKALQFHRDGRIKEAAGMYREVLKYTPSNTDAAYNLSSAYIELSDFSSAYELLSGLHSQNPGSAEIRLNLSVAEIGLGKTADAIDLLNGLDSENAKVKFSKFLHLGVAESQTGKLDEALTCYRKAEEINGKVPKLLYNMAVVNDKLGNYNDAIAYYQKFLAAGSSASGDAEAVSARIKVLKNFSSGTNK
jgi:tetratricopeptide (TPR) repeat protein